MKIYQKQLDVELPLKNEITVEEDNVPLLPKNINTSSEEKEEKGGFFEKIILPQEKAPMSYAGFICLVMTITIFFYIILLGTMLTASALYTFDVANTKNNVSWLIGWFKYKIILIVLIILRELLGLSVLITQFFFKINTVLGIIGIILFLGYIIASILFAIIVGFLNEFIYTLILSSIATFLTIVVVAVVLFVKCCQIRVLVYELKKVKGYLRFTLMLVSTIIIFNSIPFLPYRAPSIVLLSIVVIALLFLISVILEEILDKESAVGRRSNPIEAAYYLIALSTNILFAWQVILLTVGINTANPAIYTNLSTSSKAGKKNYIPTFYDHTKKFLNQPVFPLFLNKVKINK
jgi:hypothetical protein